MITELELQGYAKLYTNSFIQITQSYKLPISVEEGFYLLEYSMCAIYQIECTWWTDAIRNYSGLVVSVLNSMVRPCGNLTYEERVGLITLCSSYFVAYTGICI